MAEGRERRRKQGKENEVEKSRCEFGMAAMHEVNGAQSVNCKSDLQTL